MIPKMGCGNPIEMLENCYAVVPAYTVPATYEVIQCGVISISHINFDDFSVTVRTGDGEEIDLDNSDLFSTKELAEQHLEK